MFSLRTRSEHARDDDFQERSELRRGRSTVWRRWGDAQAINEGNALLILGQMALERLMAAGYPPSLVLDSIRSINQTALAICEGQYYTPAQVMVGWAYGLAVPLLLQSVLPPL